MAISGRMLFNFILFICCTLPVLCNAVTEVDVLILGAGLSGVTAGHHLQSNGFTNFLILEAQDYIGGRIKPVKFGNVTVGEGGNWIHYVEEGNDNPMVVFANELNLTRYLNNYSDYSLRNPNSIADKEAFKKALKDFLEIEPKVLEENKKNPRKGDQPLSALLAQNGWHPDTALKQTVDWWYLAFEFGVKPSEISSRHYSGFPQINDIITDPRGYKGIIDHLAQNITNKIKTEKIVTQIKYDLKSNGIEVRTKDGEVYKAKYGLCTFSTGVLASDLVEFIPELPKWKKNAIIRIPLAYYTNIYVRFPNVFWEDNEFIYNAGSVAETFTGVYNLNKKGIHEGSNILLFTALEDNSLRIEAQSDNETKAEVMATLRKMYPSVNIPEPTDFYVGRFSQNPYVRGSYSNVVVGAAFADFDNLLGRLGGLYFAGEAADVVYWGYMQGAYLTALKQAKVIVSCLNGKECPDYKPKDDDICTPTNSAVPASNRNIPKSPFVFVFLLLFVCFN